MTSIDTIFNASLETVFIPGRFLVSKAYLNFWCFVFVISLKFLFCGYSTKESAVLFLQLFRNDGEEHPASIDQGQKKSVHAFMGWVSFVGIDTHFISIPGLILDPTCEFHSFLPSLPNSVW